MKSRNDERRFALDFTSFGKMRTPQPYLVLSLCMLLTSCAAHRKLTTQSLNFGAFSFEAPLSWKKLELIGIDSYVAGIAIDKDDTAEFDFGAYSYDLEGIERMGPNSYYLLTDTSHNTPFLDSVAMINKIPTIAQYETVAGRRAKIVYPKK